MTAKIKLKMGFYHLHDFICDFCKFPLLKSSKIFTVHQIHREVNFKHEVGRVDSLFDFCKFMSFYFCGKTGQLDFPEK